MSWSDNGIGSEEQPGCCKLQAWGLNQHWSLEATKLKVPSGKHTKSY